MKNYTKENIIEYAKNLYLTYDDKGNRKYSLREIEKEITQKLHKKISFKTIKNYADKYGWEKLLQQGKNIGTQKAITEKMEKEETIKEAISNDVAERRKDKTSILKLSSFILAHDLKVEAEKIRSNPELVSKINTRELMGVIKDCENIIDNLDGKKQPGNEGNANITTIIFNEINPKEVETDE